MKKSKIPILVGAAALTLGLGAAGIGVIHAQSAGTIPANPMSNLVNAIAQRFNLNVSDVQQVFDQQKSQMEAQRQQIFKDKLQQAVTAGKLTQAQADAITAKMQEVQTFYQSLQGKTFADRQAAIKTEITQLKTWAAQNNIPTQYLMFLGGRRGHMGLKVLTSASRPHS